MCSPSIAPLMKKLPKPLTGRLTKQMRGERGTVEHGVD